MPFPVMDASELGEQTRRVLDRFHAQLRSWIGREHRADGTHAGWVDVPYDSANFTASAGTWIVESADQTTYAYVVHGEKMTVAFELVSTSTGSGLGAILRVAIPGGYRAVRKTTSMVFSYDSGVDAVGVAQVLAGATHIDIYKNTAGGNWTSSATNAINAQGQITFSVSK